MHGKITDLSVSRSRREWCVIKKYIAYIFSHYEDFNFKQLKILYGAL